MKKLLLFTILMVSICSVSMAQQKKAKVKKPLKVNNTFTAATPSKEKMDYKNATLNGTAPVVAQKANRPATLNKVDIVAAQKKSQKKN